MTFLKYTSFVLLSQVNLIRGDIESSIRNLNKIFEWDEVRNSVENNNGLDELYIWSAFNMIQLLYFIGLDSKVNFFRTKHYKIFNNTIEEAKRIIETQQLKIEIKEIFENEIYELEDVPNIGGIYRFEYNWFEDFSDVNEIYRKNYAGMQYCDYSMGYINKKIRFADLYSGNYRKIFDIDENKKNEWQKTFNVIL